MGIMLDIMLARKNNNGDLQIVNFDNFIFTHYELFPLKEKLFEDVLVYIPNKYDVISKRKYGSFPPEIIPIKDRYPHEGRINPNIPSEKMRKLYNL